MKIKKKDWLPPLALVSMALAVGLFGIDWGLPSTARRDLFLGSELRTTTFYSELEHLRTQRYESMGMNMTAHAGRLKAQGAAYTPPSDLRHCYSSFLLRTHDADEQGSLIMISRINPLHGKWYPYSFQYGGAYLYPLGAFLAAGQAIGALRLVSSVSYYYENPDDMGRIFLAIRVWSVLGLAFAACALFFFARTVTDDQIALWAGLYFILVPASIGFSKIAKPHIWAAGWTLLAVSFFIRHKNSRAWRDLLAGAVLMGLAMATIGTQSMFLPFLFWSCVGDDVKTSLRRAAAAAAIALAVFVLLNPTLPFHWDDYRNEMYFLSGWYPFKVRLSALPEYFAYVVRPALGNTVFVTALAGVVAFLLKKQAPRKDWALVWIACVVLCTFQLQAVAKDTLQVRPYMMSLGVLCFFAAWLPQILPWPQVRILRYVVLAVLLRLAAVYDLHFYSDKMPSDNATQAALWIQQNIPKGSVIEHMYSIPTADQLPPIRFNDYSFRAHGSTVPARPGDFFVYNSQSFKIDDALRTANYQFVAAFENSPMQRRKWDDPFTNANFPIRIYRKL